LQEDQKVTIFTIGHSNHPFGKLAELLLKNRIEVLVDVRSKPQSRWVPHFNRKNLTTALPAIGIEYRWMGDHLGGLPDDPTYYQPNLKRKKKTDPPKVVDYAKVARQNWFQDAISKLIEIASEHRTAIMCSEEDPKTCHRSQLVGETLSKRGIKVYHIRGSGELEQQS